MNLEKLRKLYNENPILKEAFEDTFFQVMNLDYQKLTQFCLKMHLTKHLTIF